MKHVLQNKKFKNRELEIMREVNSTCVVRLHHYFYKEEQKVLIQSSRVSISIWSWSISLILYPES